MSVPVTTTFLVSYPPMNNSAEEWPKVVEKQGIVSILGSDDAETGSKPSSLRRTLSADMSSKKWLAQNGFSAMKKITSSHHLAMTTIDCFSSSGDEEEYHHEHLAKEKRFQNPPHSDIWSKIISQKAANHDDASKLPPYVHPLVKRANSLIEKSLEICTESLGSETGSDVFSSYPPSETGDADEDKEAQQQQQQQTQQQEKERSDSECFDFEKIQIVKYNYSTTKKSSTTARSFPPPLPSLARSEGPSLHMHSHRENGRLVLEVVAIPSQNFFQAQRQNGRLILTLVNKSPDESTSVQPEEAKVIDQSEEVFDICEEVVDHEEINEREQYEEEEEMEDEKGFIETKLYRPTPPKRASEVIYSHRSALTMKKLTGIENRNLTWPNIKFNKAFSATKLEAESNNDQKNQTPVLAAHSLPPLPRGAGASPVAAAAMATSFNSYEYFWRDNPTVASIINNSPTIQYSSLPIKNNSDKAYEQKDSVLLRGNKADSLISLLRGCKEPRRSPLCWEPHCIATS